MVVLGSPLGNVNKGCYSTTASIRISPATFQPLVLAAFSGIQADRTTSPFPHLQYLQWGVRLQSQWPAYLISCQAGVGAMAPAVHLLRHPRPSCLLFR